MRRWPEILAILAVLAVAVIVPPLLPRTGSVPTPVMIPGKGMPAVAVPAGPAQTPDLTVTVAGEPIGTVRGSFCWSNGPTTSCAEVPDLTNLAAEAGLTAVTAPGAKVQVKFPLAPLDGGLGVNLLDASGAAENVALEADGSFKAPSAPGRYLYEVSGKWPQGYANYGFVVDVEDGRLQPPPISVKIDGQPIWTVRGSSCWQVDGEDRCVDKLSPAEQLASSPAVTRAWGAQISISFATAPTEMAVYLVQNGDSEPVTLAPDGTFPLTPEKPDDYLYEVEAKWPEGSGTYGFKVEVE